MVGVLSEYYSWKGYNSVYVNISKENRRVATLKHTNGKLTSMSYAKYLFTSFYQVDIEKGLEVDHINNNKMDDRIDNYQILQKGDNIRKSRKGITYVNLTCPICGMEFKYRKRDLSNHKNPCCSRRCGGVKSHIIKKLNSLSIQLGRNS